MTEHIHITAGRTALRTLLIAVVLTASVAGTVGTAAAEPMDGKGNDPYPDLYLSLDGKGNDVLTGLSGPESRVAAVGVDGARNDVIDGKGNDVITERFPINNVTFFSAGMIPGQAPSNPIGFADDLTTADIASMALAWSQDMDPY